MRRQHDTVKSSTPPFIAANDEWVAAGAGLSLADSRLLLAMQGKQTSALSSEEAKAQFKTLKVLVMQSRQVFETEYGRVTPVVQKQLKGQMVSYCGRNFQETAYQNKVWSQCAINYSMAGCKVFAQLDCEDNTCTGQNAKTDDPSGSRCSVRNSCDGQSCNSFRCLGVNGCRGQDENCGGFDGCGSNSQGHMLQFKAVVEQFAQEQFMKDLFNKHGVSTSEAMAEALDKMMEARRLAVQVK